LSFYSRKNNEWDKFRKLDILRSVYMGMCSSPITPKKEKKNPHYSIRHCVTHTHRPTSTRRRKTKTFSIHIFCYFLVIPFRTAFCFQSSS
jgi:hypothetical protein